MASGLRFGHVHEKFSLAVGDMAASSKPLRQRLQNAAASHLMHLQAREFPRELQPRFDALWKNLTAKEAEFQGEGTLAATCRQMSGAKAKALIEEIASMEFLISHVYYEGD